MVYTGTTNSQIVIPAKRPLTTAVLKVGIHCIPPLNVPPSTTRVTFPVWFPLKRHADKKKEEVDVSKAKPGRCTLHSFDSRTYGCEGPVHFTQQRGVSGYVTLSRTETEY